MSGYLYDRRKFSTLYLLAMIGAASAFILILQAPTQAFAHRDPSTCTEVKLTFGLGLFNGPGFATSVPPGDALVDGEPVQAEATLGTKSSSCAIDGGAWSIIDPRGSPTGDHDLGFVPCIGGTSDTDDTIGPADCAGSPSSVTSDKADAPYTVDCSDAVAGFLKFTNLWEGPSHDQADDADASPQAGSLSIKWRCASTFLDKTASADGGITEAKSITVPTGATVTFTYRETNDGTIPLFSPTVVDPDCPDSPLTAPPDSGDTDGDGVLDVGETWVWTCDVVATSSFTNTATASATTSAATGSRVVTNPPDEDETSSAEVNVIAPSIDLIKDCTPTAVVGDTVTYTFTIDNNGATDLENVVLTDSLLGAVTIPPPGSIPGDTDNDGILDTTETWTVTATRTVQDGDPDPLINTATVTADVAGPSTTQVSDIDDCSTDLKTPGPTRTPGYWKTHLAQSNDVWADVVAAGDQIQCGGFDVDTIAKLMGGFWSSKTYDTDHEKRTELDHARMILAFHLQAAILNNQAFGSSPDSFGTSLADAKAAFCGNSKSDMLSAATDLDAFNNSGTDLPFPDDFTNSPGTPKAAYAAADRAFWDQPNLPGPPP